MSRCSLCGNYYTWIKELSREHTPPEATQKLFGVNTYKRNLCEPCNNLTSVYASEYTNVVKQIIPYWNNLNKTERTITGIDIPIKVRPLRFLKYICLLFFTSNNNENTADAYRDLSEFVIYRDKTIIPKRYNIHLNIINKCKNWYMYGSGLSGISDNIKSKSIQLISEFRSPPFSAIMSLDNNFETNGHTMKDISFMSRFSFESKPVEIWLPFWYVVPSIDPNPNEKLPPIPGFFKF